MNDYSNINSILCDKFGADITRIVNKSYKTQGLSLSNLAHISYILGNEVFEDLEEGYYIAVIPGGLLNQNSATVLLELNNDELNIAAYAKEGLINQHTVEGVINEIEDRIKQYIISE